MKLSPNALHASLSDPLLETMNFLNEITIRYPQAMSYCYPDGAAGDAARRSIRLSVSYLEPARLRAGIGQLAACIEAEARSR